MIKPVLVLVVFCAVIAKTKSDGYRPYGYMPMQGYTRIKRVKYSNPPPRFYNRPPVSFPNKGVYSNTPPPNYTDNDEPPPYPQNSHLGNSRPKVSKRPTSTNDGLEDEDLQNFVKYLSKQDLDKILAFAGHKKDAKYNEPYDKHIEYGPTDEYKSIYNSIEGPEKYANPKEDDSKIFNAFVQEIDFNPHEKSPGNEYQNVENYADSPANQRDRYQDKGPNNENSNLAIYVTDPRTLESNSYQNKKPVNYQANYVTEPTPISAFYQYNTPQSQPKIYPNTPNNGVLFTDSEMMPEENLPRPVNLRDDQDFDVAFTNNVPVKTNPSYKVENFGDLPLMNYNSKLDTLSSYHVPHYTVTSSKPLSEAPPSYGYGSHSSKVPPVEPAPPSSAGKEQSDAHLKAVRIWSHRSTGTAYTLHDDGTLSLEKQGRPKGSYGYS